MSEVETKKTENSVPTGEKNTKKKFSMPSSLMIIIGVMFFFIVVTWILDWSGATYDITSNYAAGEIPIGTDSAIITSFTDLFNSSQIAADGAILSVIPPTADSAGSFLIYMNGTADVTSVGILGFGNAMAEGFGNAYSLIFYLFILGALIEIMLVSGTLEAGVGSLVKGLNGKEILLIPILFVLFSAGGTVYGMQEETLGFFIIIVPALVLAGFDTVTGLLVILLATTTGFAMSTVNPFAVGAAEGVIDDAMGNDLTIVGVGLIFRMIWWVALTAIGASLVTGYAYSVQKNKKYSFKNEAQLAEDEKWVQESFKPLSEVETMTGRQKGALALFMGAFGFMILMMVPWPDLIGYDGISVMDWPTWISWILNGVAQPGYWYFGELVMLFTIITILVVLVLKMPFKQASETAWIGAKNMFSVAILIGVARSIPVILENSGTQDWLVGSMTQGVEGMSGIGFVYMMVPILFILALIIPSTSGLAGAALPLITGAAIAATGDAQMGSTIVTANQDTVQLMSAVMVVFLMMVGMANMFVPTQAVVMAQMDASHVDYGTAIKPIGAYVGIMMVITLAAIIPSTMLLM